MNEDTKYIRFTFKDNDEINFEVNGNFSLSDFMVAKDHFEDFIVRQMKEKFIEKETIKEPLLEMLKELFK